MPSASTWPSLIRRTSLKWRTSSRRRAAPARSRNRFEVSFASPTGPLPSLSRAAKASFFVVCRLFVEESPAHRIAGLRDVTLGEHDLEQVRVPLGRAEHLGAAVQVDAPDAAEALVEALRMLEGADRDHLVVLAARIAEIAEHLQGTAEPPPLDLAAHHVGLRGGGIDAGDSHPEALMGVEHETAEAGADIDYLLARREQQLPRHVVDLVPLRFLERARAFLPVRAGVHHY